VRADPTGVPRRPRFASPAFKALALAALALGAFGGAASGQSAKKAAIPTTPADDRPLARYFPRENLVAYVECVGLDQKEAAWHKTAAYKILTETTTGEMLDAMAVQLADKALSYRPNHKVGGSDLVGLFKMMFRLGFAAGVSSDAKGGTPPSATLVVRGAAAKEHRQAFSRLIGTMTGDLKSILVKKGGRSVVVVGDKQNPWVWWGEGNDVVFCLSDPGQGDSVIAALEGKRPSLAGDPLREDLLREDGAFTPVTALFVDAAGFPEQADDAVATFFKQVKQVAGLDRIDVRWGFQDDALMSVTRLRAPRPRRSALAAFDQPAFDKSKLPPLPEGLGAFTVLSLDAAKTLDLLTALDPSNQFKGKVDAALDALKAKGKMDPRKDMIAQLGPKFAVYVMPGGTPARSPGESDPAAGTNLGLNLVPGGLGAMLGGAQVPRLTAVAEVKDPVVFGKALDNLMVVVNRAFKDQANDAADAAEKALAGPGGGENPGRPPAGGGGAGGGNRRRGAAAAAPAVDFKLMPGVDPREKTYVLHVPPGSGRGLPAGVRPTVRLGARHVVVATTPDAARLAIEAKEGAWSPPADLRPAFDRLPAALTFLSVTDPRDTLPAVLAKLPGAVQAGFNAIALAGSTPPPATTTAPAGGPPAPRGRFVGATPGGPMASSPAGGNAPSSGGGGGGGDSAAPAAGTTIQFNIDAAKLPKADDVRTRLFPAALAVKVDDAGIEFISRSAFPNLVSPGSATAVALLLPAVQAARAAARRAEAARNPTANPTTPPAAAAPGRGPAATPGAPAGRPSSSSERGGRDRGPGRS